MIAGAILNAFAEALHGRNIVVPCQLIADGQLHRCDAAANGNSGKGDAAYILFDDGLPAGGFQNWRDGQGWQDWHDALPARNLSAEQLDNLKRRAEEARRQRDEDARRRHAEAAARAAVIWEKAATVVPIIFCNGRSTGAVEKAPSDIIGCFARMKRDGHSSSKPLSPKNTTLTM